MFCEVGSILLERGGLKVGPINNDNGMPGFGPLLLLGLLEAF